MTSRPPRRVKSTMLHRGQSRGTSRHQPAVERKQRAEDGQVYRECVQLRAHVHASTLLRKKSPRDFRDRESHRTFSPFAKLLYHPSSLISFQSVKRKKKKKWSLAGLSPITLARRFIFSNSQTVQCSLTDQAQSERKADNTTAESTSSRRINIGKLFHVTVSVWINVITRHTCKLVNLSLTINIIAWIIRRVRCRYSSQEDTRWKRFTQRLKKGIVENFANVFIGNQTRSKVIILTTLWFR